MRKLLRRNSLSDDELLASRPPFAVLLALLSDGEVVSNSEVNFVIR